ncbi:alpha/beta-hydrolase [Aureobasidium sp. EXF-10727]|nr:alpha/beta-hydrolase [Aureobasidium sp. EXF-10727]
MAAAFDPNPSIGPPTLMDKLQCLVLLPILPMTCLRVLLRRLVWGTNNLSFKADFICSVLRAAQTFLPISMLRALTKEPEPKFPLSRRFADTKSELYQEVSTADFSGRWICKGCPRKPTAASKVDLVILYVHGGAYQIGHPASAIAPFLRIAEIADEKGISVAVFVLDYSLTPEAQYPTQVNQAKAAYNYLLNDQHVDHSKIAMLGDSAGAHLILNLLCVLADEKLLPKPEAGAFLVAPWIDLRCSKDGSFVRNKDADYLVRDLLITAGEQVMPRELDTTASHIVNFSLPRPNKQSWAEILPSKVWVGIGSNDTLLDDAVAFVDRVKADGVQVDFEIDNGKVHDWHIVEDVFDTDTYFATVGEVPERMMKGAATMARAVLSTVSR